MTGLIGFGWNSFKFVGFQRPGWIGGSFSPAFYFTGLVEIAKIEARGEVFLFAHANRPKVWNSNLYRNTFLFDHDSRFFNQ